MPDINKGIPWYQRWRKGRGSAPKKMVDVNLYPSSHAQYFYQEKQTYNWPSVPAHEQRSALVNCWQGNQLPSTTTFIPGVPASQFLWNVPTSYANTLVNQQYNKAFNIQQMTPQQQATMLQQAMMQWQNRALY